MRLRMKTFPVRLLLALYCSGLLWAQGRWEGAVWELQCREILPAVTDSTITRWVEPHLVCYDPTVVHRQQLLVFLPGSFGKPRHYRLIVQLAARLGFHAVGLRYPNSWTVHSLCAKSPDSLCHEKVRAEIFSGVDHSSLLEVDSVNSIRHRLWALLHYLERHFPEEGWEQFLQEAEQIRWDRIVVAGHSQGGGHAAFVGKHFTVARVLMFAWSDLWRSENQWRIAPWITPDHATPAERYFGFTHTQDNLLARLMTWQLLGMDRFGAPVNVDTMALPYAYSHQLVTSIQPARFGAFHGSVAVDDATPLDSTGTPVLEPVWSYLLIGAPTPVAVEKTRVPALKAPLLLTPGIPIRIHLPAAAPFALELVSLYGDVVLLVASPLANRGEMRWMWTGRNQQGLPIPAGMYWLRLRVPGFLPVMRAVVWMP